MIDFEGGNAERPYVKGTLFNGVGNPDGKWLPGNNQIKAIRTRNGHTIEIHDEGNDGFIRIYDNKKELAPQALSCCNLELIHQKKLFNG